MDISAGWRSSFFINSIGSSWQGKTGIFAEKSEIGNEEGGTDVARTTGKAKCSGERFAVSDVCVASADRCEGFNFFAAVYRWLGTRTAFNDSSTVKQASWIYWGRNKPDRKDFETISWWIFGGKCIRRQQMWRYLLDTPIDSRFSAKGIPIITKVVQNRGFIRSL